MDVPMLQSRFKCLCTCSVPVVLFRVNYNEPACLHIRTVLVLECATLLLLLMIMYRYL